MLCPPLILEFQMFVHTLSDHVTYMLAPYILCHRYSYDGDDAVGGADLILEANIVRAKINMLLLESMIHAETFHMLLLHPYLPSLQYL